MFPLRIFSSGLRVMRSRRSVAFTPSPSGMTFVAKRQVSRSIVLSSRRNAPAVVSKRSPVTV